ncbi:hypothetical protein Tco_1359611 [Tanacetum coccineum]
MFIKYSAGLLLPKKSIGKGSQGKKTAGTPETTVDVSKESDSEPARKRTSSKRVIKKKVTISVDDNIIPEPAVALELGKSISLTEVAEEEAARQVHATHARIKSSPGPSQKLKGVQTLTPEEQLAADTIQAHKESKKISRKQSGIEGLSEGTGVSPGVPNESTVFPATLSEGTGTNPGVPDEEKATSRASVILKGGSKQESEYTKEDDGDDEKIEWVDTDEEEEKNDDNDDKSIDLEKTNNEETDDELNDDEDEEMTNVEDADMGNDDEEIIDTAKADAEKTEEVKDDIKKAKLPPTSSSLSVSSGFDLLHVVIQRVYVLEKDVQELKEADNTTTLRALLISEIPLAVNVFLGYSLGDVLHKVLQKHTEELIQKYPQQVDYKEMIEESMQANIINAVKNQLPKFLPKAVSDFATLVIQSIVDVSLCLESVSIRRIQCVGYGVLGFLGVGTTFDIFQNIHLLYFQYGVLVFSGYGVLIMFPLWSLVSVGTDTTYLP